MGGSSIRRVCVATAGALLAAGSDAPVESINPWLGMFAAVHRRFPDDARGDWLPAQALTIAESLAAYTLVPALGPLEPATRATFALAHTPIWRSCRSAWRTFFATPMRHSPVCDQR